MKSNVNVKNLPCRIYELANTFVPATDPAAEPLPIERTKIALACDCDMQYLRGVIEGLVKVLNKQAELLFKPIQLPWAEAAAKITAKNKVIGYAAVASAETLSKFDFKNVTPCAAELDLTALAEIATDQIKAQPIPRFPAIARDLSIIVDEQLPWSKIARAVNLKKPRELEQLQFVEIYRGEGIEQGKKSITISLRFRDEDGTLTHEQVDVLEKNIIRNLSQAADAKLRTL